MKLKHCSRCQLDLPISAFTSTRAKRCKPCKRLRELEQARDMQQRAMERLKKKKAKTKGIIRISDLKKKVQKVVNKYVRERDKDEPCISCQKYLKLQAGHYIAQGSSGFLRYDITNIHGQCVGCNKWNHGNLINYRINLVKKIGEDEVEKLESFRYLVKRWTREELENLLGGFENDIIS